MILTIKGADFSGAGIGTNNSIRVQLTKTSGVSGSITQNNFEKNQVISTATEIANLAVVSGYENLTVTVTMGGATVNWFADGKVTIPSNTTITGDIKINASATAISGGEEDEPVTPTMYTFTINPTPISATVTLTADGYSQSGNSIEVPANTIVTWKVSASGYTEQNGTHTVTKTESINVALSDSDGVIENKIMLYNNYTLNENKTLGSSGITMSAKTGYHTYEMVPVEPNTAYYIPGGIRVSLLNSSQTPTSSINIWTDSNIGQQSYVLTNATAAYVYITILDTKISIEEAYIQKCASNVNVVETSVISELTGVEFIDNVKLNSSSYIEADDDNYCVWKNIPIKPNTNYKVAGSARNWYLTEDGATAGTFNPTKDGVPEKFGFITPETAASVSISIYKTNMDKSADELELIEIQTTYTPIE